MCSIKPLHARCSCDGDAASRAPPAPSVATPPRGRWQQRCRVGALGALGAASAVVPVLVEAGFRMKTGEPTCPCVDNLPILDNITVNTLNPSSTQDGRVRLVEDCLIATNVDRLRFPGETYCYPTDYGRGRCEAWDLRLPPLCAAWQGEEDEELPQRCKGWLKARLAPDCKKYLTPRGLSLPWCTEPWCFVDPNNCATTYSESYYFPGRGLAFSYDTCGSPDYFDIWNAVQLEMCQLFSVVEKPYPIMWLSCWMCAFLQQLIDFSRRLEEGAQDRLATGQRVYLVIQLVILITETIANIQRIPWSSGSFWTNYNLYVYVFINSSVFIRATMMSQIVWDWYDAKLLKYPVLPRKLDGKGWTDEMRAGLLVLIFQFASSLGIFAVISVTHLCPALIIYHWIFLGVAAGLVKSRTWVAMIGLDPESRSGRALVMGTNSFMSCMGVQVLVVAMVRFYAGEWRDGYLGPLRSDFLARRLEVWYACHLEHGVSPWDQDFINLFAR